MVIIETFKGKSVSEHKVEIVERKALGHPDHMCDSIMESISIALAKDYMKELETIAHYNIDKGLLAAYFCIKAFSETDLTEDLKKIDVPTLFLHGDDDQIVPIADSAMLAVKLLKNGTLKVYKGGAHGMCTTQKDEVNADLLAFIKAQANRHKLTAIYGYFCSWL
jgi:S-adenosylmethionine synthetase